MNERPHRTDSLMDANTTLLRQVPPSFLDGEAPTSQAFVPFPKDKNMLSVYDGDQCNAEGAYVHYTTVLKLSSAGVWGVTVAEVTNTGLASRPDPVGGNAAHALVDFSGLSPKEQRRRAKLLLAFADARGCLHKAA